jgi:hypothetical protein
MHRMISRRARAGGREGNWPRVAALDGLAIVRLVLSLGVPGAREGCDGLIDVAANGNVTGQAGDDQRPPH